MKNNKETIIIKATMNKRWIPHFISMLKYMEYLGGVGSSRIVSFYSDGDGDFRPKFRTLFGRKFKYDEKPVTESRGNRTYDAG